MEQSDTILPSRPKRLFRTSRAAVVVALLVGFPLMALMGFHVWSRGYDTVARIDCGNNREIHVNVPRTWDFSQPMYFCVYADDSEVVPNMWFGSVPDQDTSRLQFKIASDRSGDIVALRLTDDPYTDLLVFDFRTQTHWPDSAIVVFRPDLGYDETMQALYDVID